MLLAILAGYFGYKKAKATGRNGIKWAAICVAALIGTQMVFAIAVDFAIMAGSGFENPGVISTSRNESIITFAAIVPSILALLVVFRYLDRLPADDENVGPPPPPSFGQTE